MAYATNELFKSASGNVDDRNVKRLIEAKTFGSGTGTIAKNTPVSFYEDLSKWGVWNNSGVNGANVIAGFAGEAIALDGTNDVLGLVVLRGQFSYNDIVLPSGQTANNLKAALRKGPRTLGLDVVDLDQVR